MVASSVRVLAAVNSLAEKPRGLAPFPNADQDADAGRGAPAVGAPAPERSAPYT
jgi:hypothetical protein